MLCRYFAKKQQNFENPNSQASVCCNTWKGWVIGGLLSTHYFTNSTTYPSHTRTHENKSCSLQKKHRPAATLLPARQTRVTYWRQLTTKTLEDRQLFYKKNTFPEWKPSDVFKLKFSKLSQAKLKKCQAESSWARAFQFLSWNQADNMYVKFSNFAPILINFMIIYLDLLEQKVVLE